MDMTTPVVRGLVALALGLAALAGVNTVLRALFVPDWLARFAVLIGFLMVIAVTLSAVFLRKRSSHTGETNNC